MIFRVIRIKDHPDSEKVATRCIESARQYGIEVEPFNAITPECNYEEMCLTYNIHFHDRTQIERFARIPPIIASFLSHYTLWCRSAEYKEEICILEHDAVFVGPLPKLNYDKCINIGKPSFGQYNIKYAQGVFPLFSKPKFPGAHAYIVKPSGAKELIKAAETKAMPTDVFLNINNFPWLQELYPWPVEVHDTFSTTQKVEGCLAKHNYGPDFRII